MIDIQVTIVSNEGRRPLSTIIQAYNAEDWHANKARYKAEAVARICAKRHMTMRDLRKYGYNTIMTGDPARIKAEAEAKYKALKAGLK